MELLVGFWLLGHGEFCSVFGLRWEKVTENSVLPREIY
jgi:hypothetical protein